MLVAFRHQAIDYGKETLVLFLALNGAGLNLGEQFAVPARVEFSGGAFSHLAREAFAKKLLLATCPSRKARTDPSVVLDAVAMALTEHANNITGVVNDNNQ